MRVLIVASLAALAACAGQPEQPSPATTASAGAGATSGSASGQDLAGSKKSDIPSGFTRVVRHGTEYFCHSEAIAGSRLEKHETCLTQAQIDDQRDKGVDFLQQVQGMGTRAPPNSTPGQGGAMH